MFPSEFSAFWATSERFDVILRISYLCIIDQYFLRIFNIFSFYFLLMGMCTCLLLSMCMQCPKGPEKGVISPIIGVTGICELPSVNAVN